MFHRNYQMLQVFFLLSARTARLALDTAWDLLPLLLYLLCLTLILCRFERVCFLGRQQPDCMGEDEVGTVKPFSLTLNGEWTKGQWKMKQHIVISYN